MILLVYLYSPIGLISKIHPIRVANLIVNVDKEGRAADRFERDERQGMGREKKKN